MSLRESRQRRVDVTVISHYQLAESVWYPAKGRSKTKIVYSFGRTRDPQVVDRLRKLARSILRRCSPDEIVADEPGWRVENAWPYGGLYVLESLWQRLGLADRGVLRDGMKADVVVFDPESINANNTKQNPRQLASGVEYVIVNGTVVIDGGAHTGALAGRALRRGRDSA